MKMMTRQLLPHIKAWQLYFFPTGNCCEQTKIVSFEYLSITCTFNKKNSNCSSWTFSRRPRISFLKTMAAQTCAVTPLLFTSLFGKECRMRKQRLPKAYL